MDSIADLDFFARLVTQGSLSALARVLGKGAAIGFREDDAALREKIDAAIEAMKKDGTYLKIRQRYFDFDISSG
jgi:ABC-type amino acid transport substrate-binding protein